MAAAKKLARWSMEYGAFFNTIISFVIVDFSVILLILKA
jgi:large-conductance mechanosensitive channel